MSQGDPGESFTNFTANGTISGAEVWSIYEDESGNIWFPAENSGVYRYNAGSGYEDEHPDAFTNFDAADGLNTNGIQSIFRDKEGRFWFGGWGGLFRYDGKSFYSVTKTGPWH
ncbi:MAG: regulator, partial [Saprospiraceae bacterium]|nr:regulator [Saprospiraceae bacterium]